MTLEYLETQGVPVAAFGATKDFPAFFTPKSGFQAPFNVEDEAAGAELLGKTHVYRVRLILTCTLNQHFFSI